MPDLVCVLMEKEEESFRDNSVHLLCLHIETHSSVGHITSTAPF